jgi:SPP1 gp7 family putative phage head morphogenesis protein|tara:strand:+ start:1483 stop:2673 length:1191 start_codon:yes stop_codon:yes gene_type:complete
MSTPESLYRNAIDLNRYSNSVARRVINAYNDIILDSVNQLRAIDDLDESFKAARLRSIIAQLKESLATWAGDSTELTAIELQGLAELQSEFVEEQLKKVLPRGSRNIVRSVEISPQFAQSVVVTDPTQINVVALSDDLFAAVEGAPQTFSLTAAEGATITLPNGQVVQKAFRGIAEDQAELFGQVVRQGLLTGETTDDIARRLKGKLRFGQAGSVRQIAAAGGQATTVANNQVVALVRTSINQVANAASQQVYEANQDITKKYRYVATLDSRTSAICRALDGREFEYGKGPKPPQHFNCRSTTVAVIDYDNLPFDPPPRGKRAAQGGMVPADQSYGQWLAKQSKSVQEQALGKSKVPYFNRLSAKHGPKDAIAKLVRDDGSELTLQDLRKRYGKLD